ncbi:hypothetical protein Tco_1487467, partial [Tanacetum coccineum]
QAEIGNAKVDEMDQQQSLSDDVATNSAQNVGLSKNAANEEDPKVAYASAIWTGASGSLTEPAQTSRDVDLNGLAARLGGTPINLSIDYLINLGEYESGFLFLRNQSSHLRSFS